ncbi:NADPH-dependent FMN reductase [Streptacidiphilus jiangxiensis]|uniref:FMN reductase n=1 Tax=Streptacidiphilus jiangxiensis TaxID=235985 RepID=A0A1H7YCX4_STRJI|nr:NADPH-dependent FMN reductase [Streptacidiphilus jiangxiensis]SEM43805.1 FMN reductase [Streptacidiphilus jiangxiensis]
MSTLLVISGSPARSSRTAPLAGHLARRLSLSGFDVEHLDLRGLPPDALLEADTAHPEVRRALDAVAAADGVVVATPVYKASYTGLLKAFLDLLPQDGLAGKTVLPLATGGTIAHLLSIDYALRPVLSALAARHVVGGVFLLDRTIVARGADAVELSPETEQRLLEAVDAFVDALPTSPVLAAA